MDEPPVESRDFDFDFHFLNRKRAVFYHLMFHHTTSLHINHMIFLHTFLFGALLCSSTNFISLVLVASIFILYASIIIRPLKFTAVYIFGILLLTVTAFYLEVYVSSTYAWKKWSIAVCGVSVILISFFCQLLGHTLYEEFIAPPNLIHGFLAAPILEFQCFLHRWNLGDTSEYLSIMEEVKQGRAFLRQHQRVSSSSSSSSSSLIKLEGSSSSSSSSSSSTSSSNSNSGGSSSSSSSSNSGVVVVAAASSSSNSAVVAVADEPDTDISAK